MFHSNVNESAGVVVIGRNEGDRLRRCLESVRRQFMRVVYVDSGSTDDSVATASALGADVVQLSLEVLFTAARARNCGWKRLLDLDESIEFVQFVDGDCCLNSAWGNHAIDALRSHPQAAAVSGRLQELYPRRNLYHRLAAMEWERRPGYVPSCGGVAMFRVAALRHVDGFRDSLIAGEEPEACFRLRQCGWTFLQLEQAMATHDVNMTSFRQWWRRAVRAGYAYSEGLSLHVRSQGHYNLRKVCSIWFWATLPLLTVLLSLTASYFFMYFALFVYLAMLLKIALRRARAFQNTPSDSGLYAVACVMANWPQALGSLNYFRRRLRRSAAKLACDGRRV